MAAISVSKIMKLIKGNINMKLQIFCSILVCVCFSLPSLNSVERNINEMYQANAQWMESSHEKDTKYLITQSMKMLMRRLFRNGQKYSIEGQFCGVTNGYVVLIVSDIKTEKMIYHIHVDENSDVLRKLSAIDPSLQKMKFAGKYEVDRSKTMPGLSYGTTKEGDGVVRSEGGQGRLTLTDFEVLVAKRTLAEINALIANRKSEIANIELLIEKLEKEKTALSD